MNKIRDNSIWKPLLRCEKLLSSWKKKLFWKMNSWINMNRTRKLFKMNLLFSKYKMMSFWDEWICEMKRWALIQDFLVMWMITAKTRFFKRKKLYLLMIQIIIKSVLGFFNQNAHSYVHKSPICDRSQQLKKWVKSEKSRTKLKLNTICVPVNTT